VVFGEDLIQALQRSTVSRDAEVPMKWWENTRDLGEVWERSDGFFGEPRIKRKQFQNGVFWWNNHILFCSCFNWLNTHWYFKSTRFSLSMWFSIYVNHTFGGVALHASAKIGYTPTKTNNLKMGTWKRSFPCWGRRTSPPSVAVQAPSSQALRVHYVVHRYPTVARAIIHLYPFTRKPNQLKRKREVSAIYSFPVPFPRE